MTFNSIPTFTNLTSFKEYILESYEEKMKEQGKISEDTILEASDINLFSNNSIIQECLQELGIKDLDEYFESIESLKSEENEINPEETEQEEDSFISEYFDELLEQEEIVKLADLDGDGNLSDDEKYAFMEKISANDGNSDNLSLTDMLTAIDTLNKELETQDEEMTFEAEAPIEEAKTSNRKGGSTSVPQSYQVPKYDENGNLIIENLSLDELKSELSNKQNTLEQTKKALNGAIDETDQNSLKLKEQEETAKQKLEEYQQQNDNELSKKLAEFNEKSNAVDEAENAVFDNERNIALAQVTLSEKETALNNAINYEAGLQTTLSTLEAQLASAQVYPQQQEQKEAEQEIQAKIDALKKEITNAQNAIQQAQTEKDAAQKEKENLEAQSPKLNENLTSAKNALSIVEEEMKSLEGYPEIKEYLDSYNEAKSKTSEYKQEAISTAKSALSSQMEEINKIETRINEKELQKTQTDMKYNPTEMDDIVSYFGEEYYSLLSDQEIKNLQNYIAESGMSNIGNMPSKCLQCSVDYMRKIQGSSASYKSICSFDKEEILAGIKENLDEGRPVSAMVTTQAGTRHFVTVIGYKTSADGTLKESDLLVIDTYDGQIDGMGGTGGEGGYRTLFAQSKGYRYDILKTA